MNSGSVTGFGATGGMTIQGDLTNNAGGTVRVAEDAKTLTVTDAFTNNGAAEFTQNGSNSNTYSENIGGLGAGGFLLKTGAGTQILAADQSYTGVTKINGGTLVLQGTTLSPAMDISTGALLALDTTAGNREFNAILTGSGAVEKRGDNTLTYTGTSENFTGAADVTRGALFIQGTLAASTITVRSGATLGGSGAVRGTIINAGGTVSPGSSPGALTVTGNFTQQTDGVLAMEVTPDAMDHLEVGGSAALDGALSVDITGKQTIGKYSLLHAANGVSGAFATTTIDAHDSKQKFSIIYDSNDVWLKILAGRLYAALGLSWNGVAVGQVLDGEDSNLDTPLRPVLDLLDAMEDTAVPAALRQMQPELYSGLSETGLSLQRVFFETAKNRLHAVRSGNGSPYSAQYSLYAANSGSASDAAAAEGGPAVYMIPLGFFETYKNTGDRTGFSTKAAGLAAGAGFASGHDFAVGGQLGYAHAFMDYDDPAGSSANADYLLGGVYGSLHGSAWYLDGILQTGVAWNRMNRRILFSDINASADSSFTSFLFGASLNSGYDYRVNNYTFGPVVNLDYALEDNGSAEESGAGILNLVVRGNTAQSLKTGIGFRASAGFQSGDSGEIVPEIALKWGHEFLDGSRRITAELSGAPLAPLTVRTGDPSRDSMLMTAVLSYVMKKRMRLYGCYAGELLAPDRQSHTVALGFRMEL